MINFVYTQNINSARINHGKNRNIINDYFGGKATDSVIPNIAYDTKINTSINTGPKIRVGLELRYKRPHMCGLFQTTP